MTFATKNKKWLIAGAVLGLFIITNPSISAFKEYRGTSSYSGLRRSSNFFIFSVYKEHSSRFVGILGNFFRSGSSYNQETNDTTKILSIQKDSLPVSNTSYINRVYLALKDNIKGFNKTPDEFKKAMKDSAYAARVYFALKENLTGFNKSKSEFMKLAR